MLARRIGSGCFDVFGFGSGLVLVTEPQRPEAKGSLQGEGREKKGEEGERESQVRKEPWLSAYWPHLFIVCCVVQLRAQEAGKAQAAARGDGKAVQAAATRESIARLLKAKLPVYRVVLTGRAGVGM